MKLSPSLYKSIVMEKNPKIVLNDLENEDIEYILYPENAIRDINQEKLQQKSNAGAKTILQTESFFDTGIKNLQRVK